MTSLTKPNRIHNWAKCRAGLRDRARSGLRPFDFMRPCLQKISPNGLVLLGYAGLIVAFTYPLAFRLQTHLPGDYDTDMFQHAWEVDHVVRSVLALRSPYFTDDIFYPAGVSLVSHNLNLANSLFAMPFLLLLGIPAGYNLTVLLLLTLSGFTCYLLAQHVTGDRCAAFVAGAVFTLSPHHTAHLYVNHLSEIAMCWLPLYLLMLLKTWDERGWRNPLAGAVVLATVVLGYGYYGLYAVLFVPLLVAARLVTHQRRALQWARFMRVGLLFGLAGVLVSWPLWPVISQATKSDYMAKTLADSVTFSVDLFDFFLPSFLHPLLKDCATRTTAWAHANPWEATAYLGASVMVLAVLALVGEERRQTFLWLLVTGFGAVMALGPVLHVAGQSYSVPMPYEAFFRYFPMAHVTQVPARFNVLTMLGLAVLSAFGTKAALRWRSWGLPRWTRAALVLVPVTLEYWIAPFPTLEVSVPPIYETIAKDTEVYAIAEFPNRARDCTHNEYQYYQLTHRKKLPLAAYGGREPPGARAYYVNSPLLQTIDASCQPDRREAVRMVAKVPEAWQILRTSLADLRRDGFRHIFVHVNTPILQQAFQVTSSGCGPPRPVEIADVDWILRPLVGTSFECGGIVVYPLGTEQDRQPPAGCTLRYGASPQGPVQE